MIKKLVKYFNIFLNDLLLNGYFFNDFKQSIYKKNVYELEFNKDIWNVYDENILNKMSYLFLFKDFFKYIGTFEDGSIKIRFFKGWKKKAINDYYSIYLDIDDSAFEKIEYFINEEGFFD